MAGQNKWGNAGDATNAYIVVPKRKKELYYSATWKTIVAGITGGRKMVNQQMRFGNKSENVYIGNTSAIWETEIKSGNEERITMVEDRKGMPSGYGDYPVQPGNYDKYKHDVCYANQIDSDADPIPGRCSQKQVNEILNDPKGTLQDGQKMWAAQEVDFEFIRAMLLGASRNLLSTAKGGLGISLYGATAGQTRSCYNTYTPYSGLVTASAARATHEANVATALTGVADNALYAFDLGQHNILKDLLSSLYIQKPNMSGQDFSAIVLSDPWLVARLAATGGDYDVLQRAANARGDSNPAIDHLSPIVLDGVMYIPYEPLKAFRASVANALPVYGAGLDTDPRGYIATNTAKICGQIWLGRGAVLRATDRMMWNTVEKDRHKENYEFSMHWDDGFKRTEEFAKDGRTEMENKHSMVAWFYDPGPEKAFSA